MADDKRTSLQSRRFGGRTRLRDANQIIDPALQRQAAMTRSVALKEQAATPPARVGGYGQVYPKSDGKLYFLDTSGVEHCISGTDATAGDYVESFSDELETGLGDTNYTKVREIKAARSGTYRVKWRITGSSGAIFLGAGKSRVYVNDAAVGVEKTFSYSGWENESDDISGIVAGDRVQLWVDMTTPVGAVCAFALCVDSPGPYVFDMACFAYNTAYDAG